MDTRENRILLSVIFTDIEGFSALTQKDEAKALEYVRRYRKIVTDLTAEYRGDLIHFYGDGSLTVHPSSFDAVRCAIKMQEALGKKPRIPVRIGIHLGEVVMTEETIYGNAVNIAARIQSLGSASSILISGSIAREMENQPEIKTTFIGPEYVKNIKHPVDIHAICSEGIVIPSRQEIHDRNKAKSKSPYIIAIIIGLALVASMFTDTFRNYLPWGNDILDSRILVLPFINETGDATIDHISEMAAISIMSMMEDVEQIKLVSMQYIWGTEQFKSFGVLPYSELFRNTHADNFISGRYTYENDSTIAISSVFINGRSGKSIEHFPIQYVDRSNITPGLMELSNRIIGYLLSSEYNPLTSPNQDAFYAYTEALRVWGRNNYLDSRKYLLRAVELDSTFLDAYFLLADTYFNYSAFVQADSVFAAIKERFSIETSHSRKKNEYYFYESFYSNDYRSAYKYLLNVYNRDKDDLFMNTTAANYSLFFVNEPKRCVKILRKISFDDIEYQIADNRRRLTTGIQAYCAIGRYKKAIRLADKYPSNQMILRHHKMKIRAFSGVLDTASINTELARIRMNFDKNEYVEALYWTKQQFTLLKELALADFYLNSTYRAVSELNTLSDVKSNVLYDMGRLREGLDHALFLHDFAPYFAQYTALAGLGYALIGDRDSALIYLNMLEDSIIIEYAKGEVFYEQACLFTTLKDYQSALIRLRNAVDHGLVFYEYNAEFDPRLMPLFDKPEFQQIIHPLAN